MEGWMKGFKDFVRDVVKSQGFSYGYFFKTIVKHLWITSQICGVIGASFFNDESVLVVPWVFADDALKCREMICGVII